jgi:hypothetical protein
VMHSGSAFSSVVTRNKKREANCTRNQKGTKIIATSSYYLAPKVAGHLRWPYSKSKTPETSQTLSTPLGGMDKLLIEL